MCHKDNVVTFGAGLGFSRVQLRDEAADHLGLKGVTSQIQGDQVRVTGKKRDDLQAVISACKEADIGVPLQFSNFRD